MNNYRQPGEVLTLTTDRAVSSGGGFLKGSIFGVASGTYASGDAGEFATCGVYGLAKTSAQAWAVGQPIYWDNTNYRADSGSTVGPRIGTATEAADNPSSTGYVKLDESGTSTGGGTLRQLQQRVTIAEINAGLTLLPAQPGLSYRLVDAFVIAVGGAVGAVTTVDILGTLTTSRKLVAFAQASLTQSTLLRAGASGATILANGASFTANDANTAITIGKTGSDVTTATHIDVTLFYTVA